MRKVNDKFNKTVIVSDISDLRETVGGRKKESSERKGRRTVEKGKKRERKAGKLIAF